MLKIRTIKDKEISMGLKKKNCHVLIYSLEDCVVFLIIFELIARSVAMNK